jgi:hypothetical protein
MRMVYSGGPPCQSLAVNAASESDTAYDAIQEDLGKGMHVVNMKLDVSNSAGIGGSE